MTASGHNNAINHGSPYAVITSVPMRPTNCAQNMFIMNGNESSIAYISELKRFNIRPIGVILKKLMGA